ncbi:quinol dehydrogenase [Campylobacterota bacterium]|nr:quinol dehydrogenase [Campylobacterota bacterium]
MSALYRIRFLLLRRFVQIGTLALFALGNYAGLKVLQGNLSGSRLLDTVPLSDPFAVLQLLFAGGVIFADFLIGALIVLAVYAAIGGRAFCAFVCPINMVADFAAYLRRKLGIDLSVQRLELPRKTRYFALLIALLLSALLGVGAFEMISPIGLFARAVIFGAGVGMAAAIAVFLFDLFALKNGFCGHLCPLGGFYAIIGRFGILRVKFAQNRCTHCLACKQICPEKQVLSAIDNGADGVVTSGECTRCGRCIEACESGALGFSIFAINKKDKR